MHENQPILLLTPGPLTTAPETKEAMLRDWGSRDTDFIALTKRVRDRLLEVAGCDPQQGTYTCIPVQGSGTFAVEAAIGSLLPRDGKLLVLVNGAYGRRIVTICDYLGRDHCVLEWPEDQVPEVVAVEHALADDPAITHVMVVHCETTSGILNPLADIAQLVADQGRKLMVDAMSSFGALPLDLGQIPVETVIASANKCLEGVPGLGFVITKTSAIEGAAGNAASLSLDLHDQWTYMEKSGQWRFTPPTHVIAAFDKALEAHAAEGGVAGRGKRYQRNCDVLLDGMAELGFTLYLDRSLQAPIIATFLSPKDAKFDFEDFYDRLHARGLAIYPGKLTQIDSFRIGCIGNLDAGDMSRVVDTIGTVIREMGIADLNS